MPANRCLGEDHGGQGLGCLAAGVIHEEIARVDLLRPHRHRRPRLRPPKVEAASRAYAKEWGMTPTDCSQEA